MRTRAWLVIPAVALAACGGNRDQLLADLQNPRPDIRARAVAKLAKQGRTDDLVLFTRAAKDVSPLVRAEAASALGTSQDGRVVDLLGELLEDMDERVQGKAALALSDVKNDKAKAYLTLQYGRRGQATREVIVQALARANVPGAMAHVVSAEAKTLWDRTLLVLNEGGLAERVAAAEELGKSGRADAVTRLLPLLSESQVVLAAAAARGLADAGDRRAVGPIALLLNENFPELREAASVALMKLQDPMGTSRLEAVALERSAASPAATDALLAMPASPQTNAALCAVATDAAPPEAIASGRLMRGRGGCPLEAVLTRLGRPATLTSGLVTVIGLGPTAKAALPLTVAALSSTDGNVRALAAEAVAQIGDASAAPALDKAFEAERTRMAAMRADWVKGPVTRGTPVTPTPAQEQHTGLFERVRQVTSAKAREAGQPPLPPPRPPEELVDDVTVEQVRPLAALLRAIAVLKVPNASATLKAFADDPSAELRAAALGGLVRQGAEGINLAQRGLASLGPVGHEEVSEALAQQGKEGQLALVEALPTLRSDVGVGLAALQRHGAPPEAAEAILARVMEGGSDAPLAAEVLARMKAPDVVAPLVELLEKPSPPGQREILLAVGAQGDRTAAATVARSLHHDSPEVREAAAEALRQMGTPAQAEALDALQGDYYRSVREAAKEALTAIQGPAPVKP